MRAPNREVEAENFHRKPRKKIIKLFRFLLLTMGRLSIEYAPRSDERTFFKKVIKQCVWALAN